MDSTNLAPLGTVEFDDLKQLFPENVDEANQMMKELNIQPHQRITYERFLQLMRSVTLYLLMPFLILPKGDGIVMMTEH